MDYPQLLNQIRHQADKIQFADCLEYIDNNFNFTPTAFENGSQHNDIGQNNGSCKIFGLLHNLTELQTLACFGDYYRKDVLKNPDANDHQNIRQFMLTGWPGIKFSGQALLKK